MKRWNDMNKVDKVIFAFIIFSVTSIIISKITLPNTTNITKPETKETTPSLTATSKDIKKYDIQVTSRIVKKTDKKYRYFFDIRNNDTEPFNGSIEIQLITKQGKNLYKEVFKTDQPIEVSLGKSVYIDLSTGPQQIMGEYGIDRYSFSAKIDNKKVVTEGDGIISSELEIM